ncbi:50S ribosomal protein L18 [Candidatus Roizmanbacteria bacterium RIFOXYB2_FULL_38_10]|uniref:Large ribosomal subunit protein uL18 n=1 Tax=Candidatus Roizmanbacteria bacterium RIFOXYD1_FULL_38_12 TaxID=1802093 RepID=A0A1F7KZT9_9BACT|nr:MAG: 50S ribosomal protein L18 [Candidatus Roizmanbacteria bacterium RIFOXYA2_FULL_38_14]OGK63400.1 MAG: 50S ribosomal protein L18 [Candidatus Roizmanbacteria bacterium RIFOXYA1_FULL_37_12]OGK65246.1 MAG: 50S ribosomal protein L18 [Candidatus Roizmanbacteria bacterium RIFOXYB1_FULL_40_23]OGK68799.1 MAG: 50S ribosomal protein L18 [Candidatus Roizmanbacteria bacterium RIFOXYB2_FULL_38_10]OGK69651.1 MAG: 50S ribosomal protein L18 [Candidatus Roizmanbacteria bacterium RIFOXYC1_FULL_38_14]OGK728
MKTITTDRKLRRKLRVSKKIHGTSQVPRISVFRSSKYIYAQAIDDDKRVTICSFSVKNVKTPSKMKKSDMAKQVGVGLANILKEKKIAKALFDRGAYSYLGRVKKVAEGLREAGLQI